MANQKVPKSANKSADVTVTTMSDCSGSTHVSGVAPDHGHASFQYTGVKKSFAGKSCVVTVTCTKGEKSPSVWQWFIGLFCKRTQSNADSGVLTITLTAPAEAPDVPVDYVP